MPAYTKTGSGGDILLANTMPQAEYMYGCTPTSVGMILGYYDLYGYHGTSMSNIISGTVAVKSRGTDGDAYDMDAFDTVLGKAIATTGYVSRFHSRDGAATTPEQELPYTFVGSTTELNTSEWDCLADYLGTGQYWRGNGNLSTTVTYCTLSDLYTKNYSDGTLTGGSITRTIPYRVTSMLYGLDLYVQSRGYSLDYKLTGSFEVDTAGGTFTFNDYMNEIDAGRPVLISIKGHSMVGYGYNASTQEIIFDDCYKADQRMKWGGTYTYSGESRAIQSITTIVFRTDGTTPQDLTAPTVSNIKVSTTAPTNQSVTVTATFSDDVSLASSLYRIGDSGQWTAYPSKGVTVTQNATVYFKAVDAAGNESSVYYCTISNIDKTPPAKPAAKADVTASTTKPVSVTATFSSDSVKKEYSLDNKTWKTYSGAVKFTSNGTVYFRGTDAAGNISDVTSYIVSNIKSSAPDPGPSYDTSSCDNGRNDWLVDKSNATIKNSDSNFVTTALTKANTEIWLDTKGSVNRSGMHNYVGYGDDTDFAKITLATAAKLSFTVSALDASKFSIYTLNSGYDKKGRLVYKAKKLQSATLKKAKGSSEYSAETKDLLLEAGSYYISMESTNAKKGGAAYYNVKLDSDCVFYNSSDSRNTDDWDDVKDRGPSGRVGSCGTLTSSTSLVFTDWVGFGDAVDYRKFTLNSAARICLEADALDPVKISICKLESKTTKKGTTYSLKTLQSATTKVQFDDGVYCVVAKPVMLEKGDYYIRVESTTAKKGGNAKYSLYLVDYTGKQTLFYDKGNNADDWNPEILKTRGAAGLSADVGRIDNKSQFVVILSDWVGYGDEIDYRKFTVRNNVAASFLVYGSDAMKFEIYRLVGKTDKKGVTTYSLKTLQSTTAKKPKGGSQYLAYTTPLKLEAGTYYFSVKSTNAKKGGSSDYSVAINSMEAYASAADALAMPDYASAADALAMPETDAFADSLAMPDGLSFGQYDTDVLAGSYLDSASDKLFGESGAGLLASL